MGEPDGRLLGNALGRSSDFAIAIASTAPAYSLTATLGLLVSAVGAQAPAMFLLGSSRSSG